MTINFSYDDVVALAGKHRVIPVIQTLFSGSETPLSIFEKLAAEKPGSFLLESAEQGVWARYSFIGVRNRGTLTQPNPDGTASAARGTRSVAVGLDFVAARWASTANQRLGGPDRLGHDSSARKPSERA
jgi:anthranilate/para-aminobenzoate synthase component I